MGRQYRVCPFCGDHLDAGEICECRKEAKETKGDCSHDGKQGEIQRTFQSLGKAPRSGGAVGVT